MIVVNNEEYKNTGPSRKQVQVDITTGTVALQLSQDGLPFHTVKTYSASELELIDFVCACNYKFVISGTAQVSLINAYFTLSGG